VAGRYPLRRKIDDTPAARRYAPRTLKTAVARTRLAYGRVVAERCALPSFLIIGAQRSGTTSLYKAIASDPLVAPPRVKEVHYFDKNYDKPELWYRSHFPTRRALSFTGPNGIPKLTGEATPDYLYYEEVPPRVRGLLPHARLVVILRDPVARAYSHYQHERALGYETLDFADAIEQEEQRLASGDWFEREHHSYRDRGIYAVQLRRWMSHFGSSQITVVESEAFYENDPSVYLTVLRHIGLRAEPRDHYPRRNGLRYDVLDRGLDRSLRQFFRPHNEELFELLGRRLRWE
jgi:hypothetical protein